MTMAKIKIRYKAQIAIKAEFDESEIGLLSFAEIEKNVKENMTSEIKTLISDEFDTGKGEIAVTELYAHVWRWEDDE